VYFIQDALPQVVVGLGTGCQRGGGHRLLRVDSFRPVIGLSDQTKERRRRGPVDPDRRYLNPKETNTFIRVIVEPIQRSSVLVAERGGAPDDRGGIGPAGVGE
jgi:hypothetical protein